MRESIDRLTDDIRDGLGTAIGEAQGGADRLAESATVGEAGDRMDSRRRGRSRRAAAARPATEIAEQQDRFAALLATVDDGVGDAQSKLTELASMLAQVEREAASLSAETAPALVAALVQVKEAAAHAAERAREAIECGHPGKRRTSCRAKPATRSSA